MGTEITLSLNGIDIDYGKNEWYRVHHWLFPPGSLVTVPYTYADGVAEKPGFETTLDEAWFRLKHLGYARSETDARFEAAFVKWNRTGARPFTYADLVAALYSIDFAMLAPHDLAPYGWDFRSLVASRLADGRDFEWEAKDFISSLDFHLVLRVIADRATNRGLPLRWHHQDLIDSGWATIEDLTEIDRPVSVMNHTLLYGRLHDYSGRSSVASFDDWLARQGVARSTAYFRPAGGGRSIQSLVTAPTAIRHMIHHPENTHNAFSDRDLEASIETLLAIAKGLSPSIPGVA